MNKAFYDLLVLKEIVLLSRESLTQLRRHAESVQKRYETGLVPQFELLRAQVQVANLRPKVIEAENGSRIAGEGFKLLLGMNLDQTFRISGELTMVDEKFDLDSLTVIALAERIELRNLKHVEHIARLSQAIASRANLPTVIAGARYERKKPYSFGGTDWGSDVAFNIGVQFPFFNGFKNLYQYKQSGMVIKEARLAVDNLKNGISFQVRQAYLTFLAAREAITAAQENVIQAEKAFSIVETRYKNGLATNLEYLDAQLALMQAKTNHISSLKNYHNARAEIHWATGKEE